MNCDIENLLWANWEKRGTGGLDAASIEQSMGDADRAEMIRRFHQAYDEHGLPRPSTGLKDIVDLASWCLYRRDSLLFCPPEIRSKSIAAAAKHDFNIAPEVLRFLIRTCGNLLSTDAGKRECHGAGCLL